MCDLGNSSQGLGRENIGISIHIRNSRTISTTRATRNGIFAMNANCTRHIKRSKQRNEEYQERQTCPTTCKAEWRANTIASINDTHHHIQTKRFQANSHDKRVFPKIGSSEPRGGLCPPGPPFPRGGAGQPTKKSRATGLSTHTERKKTPLRGRKEKPCHRAVHSHRKKKDSTPGKKPFWLSTHKKRHVDLLPLVTTPQRWSSFCSNLGAVVLLVCSCLLSHTKAPKKSAHKSQAQASTQSRRPRKTHQPRFRRKDSKAGDAPATHVPP